MFVVIENGIMPIIYATIRNMKILKQLVITLQCKRNAIFISLFVPSNKG